MDIVFKIWLLRLSGFSQITMDNYSTMIRLNDRIKGEEVAAIKLFFDELGTSGRYFPFKWSGDYITIYHNPQKQ